MIAHIYRYKDGAGTYSITQYINGNALLRCYTTQGDCWCHNLYTSYKSAKIALGRYCGGMPKEISGIIMDELTNKPNSRIHRISKGDE